MLKIGKIYEKAIYGKVITHVCIYICVCVCVCMCVCVYISVPSVVVMGVLYKLGLKLSNWEVGWSSIVGTLHYYS